MAIIDQKGRLFGLINLLDLVVLLAVLGAAGLFGYKTFFENEAPVGNQTVQVQFQVDRVRQPTINELQVGAVVFDGKSGAQLGKIVAVETLPAQVLGGDGEYTAKNWFDHRFTVEGIGIRSDAGTSLGGVTLLVGAQPLKTAGVRVDAVVWNLNPTLPEKK
jgi:hypothetical protein